MAEEADIGDADSGEGDTGAELDDCPNGSILFVA